MNITQENVNEILERYMSFVDKISNQNNYASNIRHLLYIIVPAFIIRYGFSNEQTVLKCFEETKIIISSKEDKRVTAFFKRILTENKNGFPLYQTQKFIVLNEYKTASMTGLIDNIVHEFNHAVNSIKNEILYDDTTVSLRTGLSYLIYNRKNINQFIKKTEDITLEEIINTNQTASIINIINSFGNYHINNVELNSAFYSLKHEIKKDVYTSDAYYLQSYICKKLIDNKTFIPTIEALRFKGEVMDIASWYDNVTGIEGSYHKLIKLLTEIDKLENKYYKAKFLKKSKLNKIRNLMEKVIEEIEDFDRKCIFK